jgi:phosphoribosylanthranilate isomerase
MIRVKICGNRTIEEAFMAVRAGADAVGLIVGARYKTEDELDTYTAGEILTALPPYISTVLVTHLISAGEVIEIYQRVPTSVIQLQNDIMPREITKIKIHLPHVKLIKSIHVKNITAIETAKSFTPYVDALLLDSRTGDRIGGTGITHDWDISSKIVLQINKPVILAGGLNPGNVLEAIRHVRPFGVDVNSGVEFADGKKDPKKINDFVRLCKNICE